jgi:hypothetical protein
VAPEAEWFVSIDGEQSGPFSLAQAQQWVRVKAADEELYCWSEGFEDWLLVDHVSYFRDLRVPRARAQSAADGDEQTAIGAPDFAALGGVTSRPQTPNPTLRPAFVPSNTPTPQPLFARTLEEVESNAPTVIEEPGRNRFGVGRRNDLIQMPPTAQAKRERSEAELEFDIGEASRVVRVPMVAQMALTDSQGAAARPDPLAGNGSAAAGLPGIGASVHSSNQLGQGTGLYGTLRSPTGVPITSGGDVDAPRPEVLQPRRRSSLIIPIAAAGVVVAGVVGLLIYLAVRPGDVAQEPIARTGTRSEDLGRNYIDSITRRTGVVPEESDATPATPVAKESTAGRRPARDSAVVRPEKRTGDDLANPVDPAESGDSGEVSLGSGEDAVIQGELDAGEVVDAQRRSGMQFQRCYESALKKDPFLEAPKSQVTITVSPDGQVTSVSIPALSGTLLGSCLTSSIKRWKFKKSTKGLQTIFPLVFK